MNKLLLIALALTPAIAFGADAPKTAKKQHKTVKELPAPKTESAVFGRVFPERHDDLAWENDMIAFRAYGPATQKRGEKSFGHDIFLKYPGKGLMLEAVYEPECNPRNWQKVDSLRKIDKKLGDEFVKSISYHIDHGKGMDCYAVGPTLGCAAPAILTGDSICFPWCYKDVEILENGPDRFEAVLTFHPSVIDGDTITEKRTIVLDKGSHLNFSKVAYDGMTKPLTVVTGFPRRDNPATYTSLNDGVIAITDPTQGKDNGTILLGLISMNPTVKIFEKEGHTLLSATIKPGETFDYYWGYAWDRTDIRTLTAWVDYLNSFKAQTKAAK